MGEFYRPDIHMSMAGILFINSFGGWYGDTPIPSEQRHFPLSAGAKKSNKDDQRSKFVVTSKQDDITMWREGRLFCSPTIQ
jgi:hypothetical protein